MLDAKRNLGSFRAPPILVAVLNISPNIDNSVIETLTSCDDTAVVTSSATGAVHLAFPRFKKRFTFINLDRNNLMGVLDGAKVCDSVVCVAGSEGLDAVGERLLSAGMVTFYSTLGFCLITSKARLFWTFAQKLKVKKLKLKLKKLKTQEMFRPKLKIPAIFSEIQEDFYPNITIFI